SVSKTVRLRAGERLTVDFRPDFDKVLNGPGGQESSLPLLLQALDDPPAPAEDREKLAERLSKLPGNLVKCRAPDAEVANTRFLATLRRLPNEEQMQRVTEHLRKGPDRERAAQDVVWALMNTKEFMTVQGFSLPEMMEFSNRVIKPWEK